MVTICGLSKTDNRVVILLKQVYACLVNIGGLWIPIQHTVGLMFRNFWLALYITLSGEIKPTLLCRHFSNLE